jgi:hypothetical protein
MGRVVCSYRHAKGVVWLHPSCWRRRHAKGVVWLHPSCWRRRHPSCWRRRHAKGVVGLHPGCWLRNPDLRGQLDLGELNERERPLPFETSAVANCSQSAGRDGRPTVHVIVFAVCPALLHTAPPFVQTPIKAERGLPEGLLVFEVFSPNLVPCVLAE